MRYTSPPGDSELEQKEYDPVVSILITGMGLSYTTTQTSLAVLPPNISVGFSPYGSSSKYWGDIAMQKGHDVLLHIPMEELDESVAGDAQGPLSLTNKQTIRENDDKLKMMLGAMNKVDGVYILGNSKYQLSKDHVQSSAVVLRKKNLLIACEHEPFVALTNLSDTIGIPLVTSQLWLDDHFTESAILEKLNSIEHIARKKGPTLVMSRPYPMTIRLINEWMKREDNIVEIVPLTDLAQRIKILDDQEDNER